LDEGQSIAALLTSCRQAQQESGDYLPSLDYIEGLLNAIRPTQSIVRASSSADAKQIGATRVKTEEGWPISLSAREMEVLSLIAEGKSNQEISAQLYLTIHTVKRHAYNIFAKLGVNKRTHAVVKARQLELIP